MRKQFQWNPPNSIATWQLKLKIVLALLKVLLMWDVSQAKLLLAAGSMGQWSMGL